MPSRSSGLIGCGFPPYPPPVIDPRIVAASVRRDPFVAEPHLPDFPKRAGPPAYLLPTSSDCGPPPPMNVTPLTPAELALDVKATAAACFAVTAATATPIDVLLARHHANYQREPRS